MKLKKGDNTPEELDVDMTPMIDVTFLLIVFFMIVIDLTQQDIIKLQLAKAEHGTEDKNPEKNRVTVNVTWDPVQKVSEIWVKRQIFDLQALEQWLYPIARSKVNRKTKFSEIPLLIRCDKEAPFRKVQEIMQVCATPDIQIYKIMLAARGTGTWCARSAETSDWPIANGHWPRNRADRNCCFRFSRHWQR